jgi:hypothetical protein
MVQGFKKTIKMNINASKHWMLGKFNGVFVLRPSLRSYKDEDCFPSCGA